MKNHKICIFNVLSDILHATYNLQCNLKKQSQSFDKLRTRLPASGRKHEILNPKSENYGFRKKCKTKPILTAEFRIQETEVRREKSKTNPIRVGPKLA
jgi:hypothetical protein